MNRILLTSILVILASTSVIGQGSYFKLIADGEYSKAEKKINKEFEKSPDDAASNYAMAILLINRKYQNYNSKKAYEYLIKTKTIYRNIVDEKELKDLNKIPLNSNWIDNYTDTICRFALEDANKENSIEAYEEYIGFYQEARYSYKEKAISFRNQEAYKIACQINTIDSYQNFIVLYPGATQSNDAIKKRNALSFIIAKSSDKIESYEEFIENHPSATEVLEAKQRIHELAFAEAEKQNTSASYKNFITNYTDSKQYAKAFSLFEEKQYQENIQDGGLERFKTFLRKFPDNSWAGTAQDSVFEVALKTENLELLKYCADFFTGERRVKALFKYHEVFTNDGETETLDQFYEDYDDEALKVIKAMDYEIANLGNELELFLPFDESKNDQFDEYIRTAAPQEKAFVALQRMIAGDIAAKNWNSAIEKVKNYYPNFSLRPKKLDELISILESKWDSSININSIGNGINTSGGSEYVPVISGDDKLLYFCGKDRDDNLGNEDIFVSKKINNVWGQAKIVQDLCTEKENEAPLSVSTDGNTMLLFKSGKLFYSEKTIDGWSEAIEFPKSINAANWQADAMMTSDGKGLLFISTRKGGYNLNSEQPKTQPYHGDAQYPSDIYISLLDDNNEWGEPINLGNVINTSYCERMPFLHPDMKTLYFSSDGHGGIGELDVYKTTRLADSCWNCWSKPMNMGKEINTKESDWGYKISTDGDKAFFSKKFSSGDNEDIYWLNLPEHLRPDLVATVSGQLLDKDNHPVSAEIRWEDLETGKIVGQSRSDPSDGSFFIVLPLGKNYGYFVDEKDYFPISDNIDLRTNKKPVKIGSDINMISFRQMIDFGTAVPVNNLFFNFAESKLLPPSLPELRRIAVIIKSRDLKVELGGHTDIIGDDQQNQVLSEQRAAAVKEFLISEGCVAEKLITVGYGRSKPVAPNDTDAGRAKNRRVELKFI